jgi:hypothetical protein
MQDAADAVPVHCGWSRRAQTGRRTGSQVSSWNLYTLSCSWQDLIFIAKRATPGLPFILSYMREELILALDGAGEDRVTEMIPQ